jgi:catechol 1,2-dioxygenase
MAAPDHRIHGGIPPEQAHITAEVIAATGPHANARLAQIMPSLVRHLHDFAREVQLTTTEWLAVTELVSSPAIVRRC